MTAGQERVMALGILFLLCAGAITTSTAEHNQTGQEVVDSSNKALSEIPGDLHPNVTKLILCNNNLTKLSSTDIDVLSKYKLLRELDLSNNSISVLPDKMLSNLSALWALNISHNTLSVLEPQALSGPLTELDLSHNHILFLPQNVDVGLPRLKKLWLHGNRLTTLEKETIPALETLQQLTLEDNPWNCTCKFLNLVKWINSKGLLRRSLATCVTPAELSGKSIVNSSCVFESTKAPSPTITSHRTSLTSAQSRIHPKNSSNSLTGKDSNVSVSGGGVPPTGNTWKFLVGVVIIALSTSAVIICAVKSPSWYKVLFNYRHRRLREEEGPRVMTKSRYSNFSLETEQTETSAQELEEGLDGEVYEEDEVEDEDGFIEDRYIQLEDYKEQNES